MVLFSSVVWVVAGGGSQSGDSASGRIENARQLPLWCSCIERHLETLMGLLLQLLILPQIGLERCLLSPVRRFDQRRHDRLSLGSPYDQHASLPHMWLHHSLAER